MDTPCKRRPIPTGASGARGAQRSAGRSGGWVRRSRGRSRPVVDEMKERGLRSPWDPSVVMLGLSTPTRDKGGYRIGRLSWYEGGAVQTGQEAHPGAGVPGPP